MLLLYPDSFNLKKSAISQDSSDWIHSRKIIRSSDAKTYISDQI